MATYKVIQDIEAEDKLVGPLTLRQFIYAGVAVLCLYICFLGITRNIPYVMIPFLPVALVAGFFAFPFTREQPTEVWALAKIRFLFKPRRRIWNQTGMKELVTITAPRHIHVDYTNGLTQTEVKSRLQALANTIDSRGWSTKNVNVNLFSEPSQLTDQTSSDRLIDPLSLPQDVPAIDISAADDILDEQSSPIAQHFQQMIDESDKDRRQQLEQKLQGKPEVGKSTPNDYWFLNQPSKPVAPDPGYATFTKSQVITPGSETHDELPFTKQSPEEKLISEQLHQKAAQPEISTSHLHTIQPLSAQPHRSQPSSMTSLPDSVKMRLASSNDRSVASLAREANTTAQQSQQPNDEVIVPLH